jgi:ribonucleoside-diphosphate reductase alpha chain
MGDVAEGAGALDRVVGPRGGRVLPFDAEQTWQHNRPTAEMEVRTWLHDLRDDDGVKGLPAGVRLASEVVRLRTYAKVKPDGERETWRETVIRWGSYMLHRMWTATSDVGAEAELREAVRAVFRREVMPSMRALWSAGDVLDQNDIALYNCAFAPADSIAVFWESLYVLMHGTGFGFSVEEQFVAKLPIPEVPCGALPQRHVIEDSTEGWRNAVEVGVLAWFDGWGVTFDYSQIRPAGAKLRTKGGEASGPEPLRRYLDGLRTAIQAAGRERRQLTTVEVHDLLCLAARAVQVGGVRRSAMISFSDRDDVKMRWAKHYPAAYGLGVDIPAERTQANNSWVWSEGTTRADFDQEWAVLQTSNAGERGIFSPARMKYRGPKVRANPCVEIGLTWQDAVNAYEAQQAAIKAVEASAAHAAKVAEVKYSLKEIAKTGGGQFCNLTNVILRPWDTLESARAKVALAAFLGTLQASCTRFNGLRAGWSDVTRRDALLGVGLSGQADCPQVTSSVAKLADLNALAVDANAWWAGVFGISPAAGVTCGKPDGNSSAFLGCASGIHAHHDRYYLQRITVSAASPICAVLRAAGVPCIPGTAGEVEPNAWLFEFPMAAAPGALLRTQETALSLLDRLDVVNRGWLGERGHNQSVTVNVRPDEWDGVKERIWERGDAGELGGVSFFPDEGAVYYGQPRTSLTVAEYEARLAALPVVDWVELARYETGVSEGAQTLACGGGACELR